MKLLLVKKGDSKIKFEGEEVVRKYITTEKLNFSVSLLRPGQRSSLDEGHKSADEICYVVKGHLVCQLPNLGTCVELREGDAFLIPQGESHQIYNIGDETVYSVWCGAPGKFFSKPK